MALYREETKKICYCGRCDKEIKAKGSGIVKFERVIMTPLGEVDENIFTMGDRGLYLCHKCLKDFNAFIKNKYPKERTEKEKALENMLTEVAEEITDSIDLINKHASTISRFTEIINLKVNGSPYMKDEDMECEYNVLKLKLFKFLKEVNGKSEESEETGNE